MSLNWDQILGNAIAFSKRWQNAHQEEAESQGFILDFLRVFGVDDAMKVGSFEHKVSISEGRQGYIDYLWPGRIAVEMKSKGLNLDKAMAQLKGYINHLSQELTPDLWMVSDFENIKLYRFMTKETFNFKTKDLRKKLLLFSDIAGFNSEPVMVEQVEANVKAAEKMARLYDELKDRGYDGHNLKVYLVRLLFCLFAEDTGIFPKDSFTSYLEKSPKNGADLGERIGRLFEVLDFPDDVRAKKKLLSDDLKQFRYINGGLFADTLPIADFDAKTRATLLNCCNFNWSKISPAIFGSMFQGVMDKIHRHEIGAHYTSEINIMKLIKPLFLDDLKTEYERVKLNETALKQFHTKLSLLKFLDPACGCGNFLIISYRELRLLELKILQILHYRNDKHLNISSFFKVSIEQFYGIEYEEFPCQIAMVGMWLIDHQMNLIASDSLGQYFARLPLTISATIKHGNALKTDWADVVSKSELNYILGNPPFLGSKNQTEEQRLEIALVSSDQERALKNNVGILDYVTGWYFQAAKFMDGTEIRAAFVSTSSIVQGEQVAALWKPLIENYGIQINFAYSPFKWSNEAKGQAMVFCVIVGFSPLAENSPKLLFDSDGIPTVAQNINPYLMDAPNVFIFSRSQPLCECPKIGIGNKPIDGGNYLFKEKEKELFLKKEPLAEKWFRPWVGADEFLSGRHRWCLWLGDCPPSELRKMPEAMKRIEAVKRLRLASKSVPTKKLSETPTRFHVENIPDRPFIVIPKVSTDKRRYIPIGFMEANVLASDLVFILPQATLFHFGVLSSSAHNFWIRAVCGRLGTGYRYSKDIVYNNFPWPVASEIQQNNIQEAAQGVLEARKLFPDSCLADLYDPLSMPPALLKAHKELDQAVFKAYGFSENDRTEKNCVAKLFTLYLKLI